MDPEYNLPEREDDMPPIDDELREAMEDLVRKLEKCDRLQKCFLFLLLTTVFIWEPLAGLSLGAIGVTSLIWGNRLSKRAEELARKAYPWIHDATFFGWVGGIGRGRGGGTHRKYGYGLTDCERIKAEAKRTGDNLTVRLFRFAARNICWPFFGLLAFLIAAIIKIIWERLG